MAHIEYLITGANGGLGSAVVSHLLKLVPAHTIAISSSSAANFEGLLEKFPGTEFRFANYDDIESLEAAFDGVQKLFFVSTMYDVMRRDQRHRNVVAAAKKMAVGHTYYSSQSFGGYGSNSEVGIQQFHLFTEKEIEESGIPHTFLRCGLYTEAFPPILGWLPGLSTIYLPEGSNGSIAWISRKELGEAIANLMSKSPSKSFAHKSNIALLTGSSAYTLTDTASAVSQGAGMDLNVEFVDPSKWPAKMVEEDTKRGGGRGLAWYDAFAIFVLLGIGKGELALVDPLAEELLGRKPRDAKEMVSELVRAGLDDGSGGYRWPPKKNAKK